MRKTKIGLWCTRINARKSNVFVHEAHEWWTHPLTILFAYSIWSRLNTYIAHTIPRIIYTRFAIWLRGHRAHTQCTESHFLNFSCVPSCVCVHGSCVPCVHLPRPHTNRRFIVARVFSQIHHINIVGAATAVVIVVVVRPDDFVLFALLGDRFSISDAALAACVHYTYSV